MLEKNYRKIYLLQLILNFVTEDRGDEKYLGYIGKRNMLNLLLKPRNPQ